MDKIREEKSQARKRGTIILILRWIICLLAVILLSDTGAWAKPTTPEQAGSVVMNWLAQEAAPLRAPLGGQVKEVQTFPDEGGAPLYYVVYLNPSGMVFLPADDLVEPIIGFLPEGLYDPSPINPLGALVSKDIPGRVLQARQAEAQTLKAGEALTPESPQAAAQRKWALLENAAPALESSSGISGISDLRVAPFVQSRWSQTTVDDTLTGLACYNYYTFPNAAGSASNYPCGCVATAMAQLMRHWQYPTAGVGTGSYQIKVDGATIDANLRGGNGFGGPYNWGNMPLTPSSSSSEAQRQAIGALTRDAGLSVNMQYTPTESGANVLGASALVGTFGYSNAKRGYNGVTNIPSTNRNAMINPNLQAKYPVLLGITGSSGGHAIVCDGYGYNAQTMYHHLNMGWSGYDDAWYNLPLVYTTDYNFNSLIEVGYNVFVTGSGEIIAGRVTDSNGTPISGATVTASGGYSTTTDAKGLYALAKVPSGATYTINVTKAGFNFTPQTVATGTSLDNTVTTGNIWGVDFMSSSSTFNQALDNYSLNFTTSGEANWFVETDTVFYGGSAAQSGSIANGQSTALQTTVVGPGTLSFYWKVSSYWFYNSLGVFLDNTWIESTSGGVDWTQKTLRIPAGTHSVVWRYSKTTSQSSYLFSDCAWLDKVVYNHDANLSTIYGLLLLQ